MKEYKIKAHPHIPGLVEHNADDDPDRETHVSGTYYKCGGEKGDVGSRWWKN